MTLQQIGSICLIEHYTGIARPGSQPNDDNVVINVGEMWWIAHLWLTHTGGRADCYSGVADLSLDGDDDWQLCEAEKSFQVDSEGCLVFDI